MKTIALIVLALLGINISSAYSESTVEFEISIPRKIQKTPSSLYNSIELLDSRIDTTNLGVVQEGMFNSNAKVVAKTPLANQLKNIMPALIDQSAKNGELLFQLRQCILAEITTATNETGYCFFKAELYAKVNNQYRKLASVDTVAVVSTTDVTNSLLRIGGRSFTLLISNNLLNEGKDSKLYSLNDVIKIDSVEKRSIPLYNTDKYIDGFYANYKSFSCQKPDKQIRNKGEGDKLSFEIVNPDNSTEKIDRDECYAVVHKGIPYIVTEYGYYPLTKSNDDFYFTGKAKVSANALAVSAGYLLFGVGGAILASDADAVFEMKIDHNNGGFIRIKEVE